MGNGEILYGLADDGYVRRQLSMMNNGVKPFAMSNDGSAMLYAHSDGTLRRAALEFGSYGTSHSPLDDAITINTSAFGCTANSVREILYIEDFSDLYWFSDAWVRGNEAYYPGFWVFVCEGDDEALMVYLKDGADILRNTERCFPSYFANGAAEDQRQGWCAISTSGPSPRGSVDCPLAIRAEADAPGNAADARVPAAVPAGGKTGRNRPAGLMEGKFNNTDTAVAFFENYRKTFVLVRPRRRPFAVVGPPDPDPAAPLTLVSPPLADEPGHLGRE